MTTPIPGDIVMRNGKAEVVERQFDAESYLVRLTAMRLEIVAIRNATPLGINTRDGWRVDVKDDGGTEAIELCYGVGRFERKEKGVSEDYFTRNCVVAWRPLVQRADPPAPDRDAEVRAVAAELRKIADGWCDTVPWPGFAWELRARADRLAPPNPEPLKVGEIVVGDSVPWNYPEQYHIAAIEGDTAVLRGGDFAIVRKLANVRRVRP